MTDEECQREAVAHDQQEGRDHHVGDRRREQRLFLLEPQDRECSHAAACVGRRVNSRKIRSRSGGTAASSDNAKPRPTSAAARASASATRASPSTRYWPGAFAPCVEIERTPGSAPMHERTSASAPATCSRKRCTCVPWLSASVVNSLPSSRIITRLAICSISERTCEAMSTV